jgi:type I restriction enzyme M protein
MANGSGTLESRLWAAADELRANSKLRASDYSVPVLGLIFLKYADHRFSVARQDIEGKSSSRRKVGKTDYQARGVMYLPEESRFSALIALPEAENLGKHINEAMKAIETENEELRGILPQTYHQFENRTLSTLLKTFNSIPMDVEGDVFGKIYEYFLGNFAMKEGQKGGEFFTPTSIVKLIVDIIEPYHGRIFDPACGSGGMFVQSAKFVERHKANPNAELSVFGEERVEGNVKLGRMNLAVHGLSGDIRQGNSYYEDLHNAVGRFEFVMANPPFNVNGIDKERLKDDPRCPFGIPKVDNGNYIWIQQFYSALTENGRSGFVMANSASDARASEMEIRRKIIEDKAVDVMVAISSNFFFTVTLPVTVWFLDMAKRTLPPSPQPSLMAGPPSPQPSLMAGQPSPQPSPTGRGSESGHLPHNLLSTSGRGVGGEGRRAQYSDTVLFIDARHIYRQIDRAHREFTPEQGEFLANVVRLYRGDPIENVHGSIALLAQYGFTPPPSPPAPLPEVEGSTTRELEHPSPPAPLPEVEGSTTREFEHPSPLGRGAGGEGDCANPDFIYRDIPGLCKVATLGDIEAQSWSLNPGRYVGVADRAEDDFDFYERLEELNEELEVLNNEARELEDRIADNVAKILEAQ